MFEPIHLLSPLGSSPSLPHPCLSLIAGTLLLVFPGRLEHAELLLHIEGLMTASQRQTTVSMTDHIH